MIKTILVAAIAGGSGFAGWIGGSIWPAPPEWTDAVNRSANDLRAKLRLSDISLAGLRELIPSETLARISGDIQSVAIAAGDVILVERDSGTLEEQLDNLALSEEQAVPDGMILAAAPAPPPVLDPAPAPDVPASEPDAPAAPEAGVTPPAVPVPTPPSAPVLAAAVFPAELQLCPQMVSRTRLTKGRVVRDFKPVVIVNERHIATFPTPGACLSSGFGPRNDRLHKGLDYHADTGVNVLAAGDGEIVELKYRDDYGNMIVIDHGGGVFTRYAHLASFGAASPATVRVGPLGLMGNSAAYRIPIHLHSYCSRHATPGIVRARASGPLILPGGTVDRRCSRGGCGKNLHLPTKSLVDRHIDNRQKLRHLRN
jgi:murein DD-endopeptidase MepM/ murein hydrolase activator NlpD